MLDQVLRGKIQADMYNDRFNLVNPEFLENILIFLLTKWHEYISVTNYVQKRNQKI